MSFVWFYVLICVCECVRVCVCVCVCVCIYIYMQGGVTCKLKKLMYGGGFIHLCICASVHAERKFQLKRMVAFSPAVDACVS